MKVKRWWIAWKRMVNSPILAKYVLGVIVVGFVCVILITLQVRSLSDAQRAADIYQAELRSFDTQVIQHEACLSRVETREVYRERDARGVLTTREIIDILAEGAPPSDSLDRVYERLDAELIDIANDPPPLDPAECGERPTPPEPPPGHDPPGGTPDD